MWCTLRTVVYEDLSEEDKALVADGLAVVFEAVHPHGKLWDMLTLIPHLALSGERAILRVEKEQLPLPPMPEHLVKPAIFNAADQQVTVVETPESEPVVPQGPVDSTSPALKARRGRKAK
jgi:hypothetical protein